MHRHSLSRPGLPCFDPGISCHWWYFYLPFFRRIDDTALLIAGLVGIYVAVICPIMPTSAYPHDHSDDQENRRIMIDGKDYVYPDQLSWPGIATLPGLPSTAIPTGFSPDGLPVGVQIVGPWLEDRTPLKLAELIEREFGGFMPPPMFDD